MKNLIADALLLSLAPICRADIHDPPSIDYGPNRKLVRGVSKLLIGISELSLTIE